MLSNPYFVLTMFDELTVKKGLGLIRGDIIDYQISKSEAGEILKYIYMFYMTPELYDSYVFKFNKEPNNFDYNKYCDILNLSKY